MNASPASPPPTSRIDPQGRWTSHAPLPVEVLAFYGVVIVVLLIVARPTGPSALTNPVLFLDAIVGVFLARYASTSYSMDSDRFHARRLFGSRSLRLENVRRIELASLRDLSPTGFFGGWGWRGRMWSPVVGSFDSIHTRSSGVMIYEGEVPLFVSPKDPVGLAVELSRRVRSYAVGVELGPGLPGGSSGEPGAPARVQ
ncbi:MAG TPA: hypothetical protein VGS23_01045 [Thermoplasmata archaeon]|nr:hypothetical protein [Thermoplasmata archaeon]